MELKLHSIEYVVFDEADRYISYIFSLTGVFIYHFYATPAFITFKHLFKGINSTFSSVLLTPIFFSSLFYTFSSIHIHSFLRVSSSLYFWFQYFYEILKKRNHFMICWYPVSLLTHLLPSFLGSLFFKHMLHRVFCL